MKLPEPLMALGATLLTPTAVLFLQDSVRTMIPWLLVMAAVVGCDLIVGIRKSLKLGVHVSWSMAARETMGKTVTYAAFVLMVAMIDAACGHSFHVAMWSCLFICALEGGSIVSNLLKPYGIDITPGRIVRFLAMRGGRLTKDEAEELVSEEGLARIREREKSRWEGRRKK